MQTTVATAPPKSVEGEEDGLVKDAITGIVVESAGIKPGRLVVRDASGDYAAELPTGLGTLTTVVLGVSLFSQKALVNPSSSNNEIYEDEVEIPLLRHGRVWVKSENAVTPADPVFARVAAGAGGTEIGAFRTGADTATAVAWTAAKFLTSAGASGFVLLEVNM